MESCAPVSIFSTKQELPADLFFPKKQNVRDGIILCENHFIYKKELYTNKA